MRNVLSVGSLCLALQASLVSSSEHMPVATTTATIVEEATTATTNTVQATLNNKEMRDFIMQRRGKMRPFDEFMKDHGELFLPRPGVFFQEEQEDEEAFFASEDRDLQALSGQRITRSDYCRDLSTVESFLERSFLEAYDDLNVKLSLNYECNCTMLGINWQLACGADYYGNKAYYGSNIESAVFSLGGDGLYRMVQASWGDSEYGDEFDAQETYFMEDGNGTVTQCQGNGCGNCTVCDGGEYIAMDCPLEEDALAYAVTCDDGYMGSFLSQYYFGPISENATSNALGSYQSHLEFCANMTHLETFMNSYFQDVFFASDPNVQISFKCHCNDQDINLYLKCTGPYTYLGTQGISRDSAHFEARNGVYELIKTSWGDTNFGTIEDDQEEFFYQNGRLIGCRYADCLSCRICADGLSARCEDVSLGDDTCYEPGAFTSVYDYGTIVVGIPQLAAGDRDFGSRPTASAHGMSTAWAMATTMLVLVVGSLW
ncbi:unnamed protein product [Cylindrotheca closterium]|uniref:Uncharacterized protein n=1 Tax=Cylindrotheca closterium TaxID=2856 RepID=A0AAD2PWU7_9STRA|nr:unnamed protein product [Cylindrotheca closterium]